MNSSKKSIAGFICITIFIFLFLAGRCYIANRESLWTDEFWSLVISTGHTPCQVTNQADSRPGDYVETAKPTPCSYFKEYLTFNASYNLTENIMRACAISEYSAPGYYFILSPWLKLAGISDFNLRFPSIIFSLLTLPIIWYIAKNLDGTRAGFIGCYFFAFAPMCLYFSTEARLYSQLIFLSAVFLWLTLLLGLAKTPHRSLLAICWSVVGGFGLVTSSLFLSPILACGLWLVLKPTNFSNKQMMAMLLGCAAIASLWYVKNSQILSLNHNNGTIYYIGSHSFVMSFVNPLTHLLELVAGFGNDSFPINQLPCITLYIFILSAVPIIVPIVRDRRVNSVLSTVICSLFYFAGITEFARTKPIITIGSGSLMRIILFLIVTQIYTARRFKNNLPNLDPRIGLLYLNVFFAIMLPEIFDMVKNTHMSNNHRYVLVCLPAAFTLLALALNKLRNSELFLIILATTCFWLPMYNIYAQSESRREEDYRAIGRILARADDKDTIIFSYYFPVNILGLARYMPVEKNITGWCSPNHNKNIADDLLPLIKNNKGVYLARVGPGYELSPHPIETWLQANAQEKQKWIFSNVLKDYCQYFVPKHGEVF